MELEKITLTDEQAMTLILFRKRGASFEGQAPRMDRIERGISTADAQWALFNALRDRILELEGRLSKLEPTKAAKSRRVA
jgi:hypothetical protein